MKRIRGQLAVTVVAVILGFLVVLQLKSQSASPGLAGRSAQELTVIVANLSEQNDRLRDEVRGLEAQASGLTANQNRGVTSLEQLHADLARIEAWAGLLEVTGEGVRVTIDGNLPGDGVAQVLNELRNAGAEAIAVNGVRVVPGVVVSGPAGQLVLEGQALSAPVQVDAIGVQANLTGSLTRAGGPIAQLAARFPDATVEVTPLDRLDIPATTRNLVPANGKPRI